MNTVFVVQARVASSRLPRKVLLDLAGKPLLARQLERLRRCQQAHELVVATTTDSDDDAIVDLARAADVRWYRGSRDDVLARLAGAAREARADVVVRLTADCPLIDPGVSDRVVAELLAQANTCDYASNVVRRTYPRGLDTEAMFVDVLLRIDRLSRSPAAREHVTLLARSERPELFACYDVVDGVDNSDLRWTVDTPDDLRFVRELFARMELADRVPPYGELVAWLRDRPELLAINAGSQTWTPP